MKHGPFHHPEPHLYNQNRLQKPHGLLGPPRVQAASRGGVLRATRVPSVGRSTGWDAGEPGLVQAAKDW